MRSKLFKTICLDPRAEAEAQSILESEGTDESSEFTYGTWRSYALWNGTGDQRDTRIREYQGTAHPTGLALKLPYLDSVLKAVFATEYIKWVRAFRVSDGILVPHRSLRESRASFKRLCFPMRTDVGCLHSENDCVFHMRLGEVWYLDDSQVHSACSLSPFARILICIDFDLPEDSCASAFRRKANVVEPLEPLVPRREPVDARLLEGIYSLGAIISWHNVRDIIQLLIKIHFYHEVGAIAFYEWLIEIAARSQDPKLLHKVTDFKRFCIDARDPYEIFEWNPETGRLSRRIFGP